MTRTTKGSQPLISRNGDSFFRMAQLLTLSVDPCDITPDRLETIDERAATLQTNLD